MLIAQEVCQLGVSNKRVVCLTLFASLAQNRCKSIAFRVTQTVNQLVNESMYQNEVFLMSSETMAVH